MTRKARSFLIGSLILIPIMNAELPSRRVAALPLDPLAIEVSHSPAHTKKGPHRCLKDELTQCKGAKYSPQSGGCVCAFTGLCGEEI